jgi:hypothetical protein
MNCLHWGCLPDAGGLLDQPAGLIDRMNIVTNVYNAMRGMATAKDKTKFAKENESAWKIVQNVYELREANGR